ncbi:hypothetical protein S40293_07289 [Stachybotrys chartarum IBT 40293]|nr:hypothetical protein S40293_07289 [Stachybotrys chartarum IBT 40293]
MDDDKTTPPQSFVQRLPNELLAQVFECLSPRPVWERGLALDPSTIYDGTTLSPPGDTKPGGGDGRCAIKDVSRMCRRWRDLALPVLFRHVLWTFQTLVRPPAGHDPADSLDLMRFLRDRNLRRHVHSLTVVITYPVEAVGVDMAHAGRWGVLRAPSQQNPVLGAGGQDAALWDNNWLWHAIFDHLDLTRITLISSPAILASLISRTIDLSSGWAFHARYHILALSRSSRSPRFVPGVPMRPGHLPSNSPSPSGLIPCDLFSIRDWTRLLINEGPSARVYSTYEYFHHRPPSILSAILSAADPSYTRLLTGIMQHLLYIAIFPLASHVNNNLVLNLPPVSRFYIQIAPLTFQFTEDFRRSGLDLSDLWMERNVAYEAIMQALTLPEPPRGWSNLRVFHTGDAADVEAWQVAKRWMEISGAPWKVKRKGVFIKTSS